MPVVSAAVTAHSRHLYSGLEDEDMQSFGLQLSATLSKAASSTGFGHSEG